MSRIFDAMNKASRDATRAAEYRAAEQRSQEGEIVFHDVGPTKPAPNGCLSELVRGDGPWAEQLRTLSAKLRSRGGGTSKRRLGIVSASGGEGKTTIAISLAMILGEEPASDVLLIDGDLRHRDVESYLGLDSTPGLVDFLRYPYQPVVVRRLEGYGTYALSAGMSDERPWELVQSPHLPRLFDAALARFKYVIVDCPPVGPVSDSTRLQEHLDGFVFVIRARTAPHEAVATALEQLEKEKVVGVIFNDLRHVLAKYYHYGYSYYHKERPR